MKDGAPSLDSIDALDGVDAVCVLVPEDERPLTGAAGFLDWRMRGALSRVLKSGFFTGASDDKLLMPAQGRVPAKRVFVVGLGARKNVTALGLEHALTSLTTSLSKAKASSVALLLPDAPQLDDATVKGVVKRACVEPLGQVKVTVVGRPGP